MLKHFRLFDRENRFESITVGQKHTYSPVTEIDVITPTRLCSIKRKPDFIYGYCISTKRDLALPIGVIGPPTAWPLTTITLQTCHMHSFSSDIVKSLILRTDRSLEYVLKFVSSFILCFVSFWNQKINSKQQIMNQPEFSTFLMWNWYERSPLFYMVMETHCSLVRSIYCYVCIGW